MKERAGIKVKTLRDLQWFYDVLKKGGKTAEFYEAQVPILKQVIAEVEKS